MTGKMTQPTGHMISGPSSFSTLFSKNILPWIICGLAAAFYCYEYLLRITPGLMVPELQRAFSINGQYLDATLIGHLSAFYYYSYTPMQLPVGLFMDRYGPRRVLTLAVICCALGTAFFGMTHTWWVAAFGRFWIGFGSAFAFVGVMKLASTWLPPNRFALVSGLATTLGMVGAMIGGVLLTDLIQNMGWRETIIYSSYAGFILVPIIWFIVRDAPSSSQETVDNSSKQKISYKHLWKEIVVALKNSQIWINGVIGGLLMTPTMVFPELWGKLYLQTVHQFDAAEASRAVTMIFLGWAVGGPLAGFISDLIGRRRIPLLIGALLTSILLLIFLYYPGLSPLTIKILLFFIGVVSSVEVICFAIGRENCPQDLAGTAVAVTNFLVVTFAFGQVIVAKILDMTWDGVLIDQAKVYSIESYQTSMMVLPIATLLAVLLCFFLKETYCRPIKF
ncbi:MFS transporter [Candidatus Berkiella aquae]|uniref:Lysosomal dipeptide transporter MFSD1 n=1 Tax=Candidatus Berkiella aquae TaxID=295108 RepID=A0A0Q9YP21_9GAMM|nr:MFS transporter [Candidatus Berkiella aquae]MCS5712094.1 MFS transporter [Candidatus Berkiella aquae]